MINCSLWLKAGVIFALILVAITERPAARIVLTPQCPPSPPCSAPEFQQFDFWLGDWDAFDAAYGGFFEPPYPARTTVGAKLKGILVELSVVAALGA